MTKASEAGTRMAAPAPWKTRAPINVSTLGTSPQPIEATVDELLERIRAELAVKIFGDDLETLKKEADRVAAVIREVDGAATLDRVEP